MAAADKSQASYRMLYQHSVMAFTLARRSAIRADESQMGAANRRSQY
jgi:hypothetical protein